MKLDTASNSALDRVRDRLLSGPDLDKSRTETFDRIAQGSRSLVIAGGGHLGRSTLALARAAGLHVIAFADNNQARWGQSIEGIPICSFESAVGEYNDAATFVVAVYNGTAPRQQLKRLGCFRVAPYPAFFWRFSQFRPDDHVFELPHRIVQRWREAEAAFGVLADDKSRIEFAAQIEWRCTLDYDCLPPADPPDDTYFAHDVYRPRADEVFVDCGAFDGDSIRAFLRAARHQFEHIYALEPDPENRSRLSRYFGEMHADSGGRSQVLPYAVSDRSGTISFTVTGTAGSSIQSAGSQEVECRRLDDVLTGPPPTLIKMDIEGAELAALRGATETIRRWQPVLAICAYHECEHLWTIPALIHQILPEYRLFLRRYAEECWEMVYYAVPSSRLA